MIFNTLKNALIDIDGLNNYNPWSIANHYNIEIVYSNLPKYINEFAYPLINTIFINNSIKHSTK